MLYGKCNDKKLNDRCRNYYKFQNQKMGTLAMEFLKIEFTLIKYE